MVTVTFSLPASLLAVVLLDPTVRFRAPVGPIRHVWLLSICKLITRKSRGEFDMSMPLGPTFKWLPVVVL